MKIGLSLLGAVIGCLIGFFLSGWLVKQGFYSILLPGALLGFGSLLGKGFNGLILPLVCGIAGVAACYYAEWSYFPFAKDTSLGYFIQNLTQLKPLTHIMALLGGAIAFWVPFRSRFKK